jgi:peptidoglycan/xylan/chitin deacetylase (PgdA/CDA1 family)
MQPGRFVLCCAPALTSIFSLGTSLGISLISVVSLGACTKMMSDEADIYSRGEHFVLCSSSIDDKTHVTSAQIADAIARAVADQTTVHFYTHNPGETVQLSTIEDVLATAWARGLEFTTYEQLSSDVVPGSLALSFDDRSVAGWTALRPMFARYGARVTFFVSAYLDLTDDEHAQLHQLSDDGHDIEYHSTNHLDAVNYVAAHGMDAYIADEILPGLDAMRADGYPATIFAYPFGSRSAATDAALAHYFTRLRAIRSRCPW